ncbi:hypothetical protein BN134_3987 [Cronobacter dublinensis 1210]|uniref:Uncharacterized protein n=1 Tax=Cronobacter dublinensis 1210 TaxID=1208656 RepID=A0ABM9QCD4_9ENTR|nr:hypothetical protein BN134_3987 [Cronobacter dublinensis 1210]
MQLCASGARQTKLKRVFNEEVAAITLKKHRKIKVQHFSF